MHEYLFRNGSNVGRTILEHVAIEAADLAYEQLRCSAKDLRSKDLWAKASKTRSRRDDRLTLADVEELLVLITPHPLLDQLGSLDKERVALVMGSGIDWINCCSAMENEPSFSPSHDFDTEKDKIYLFHIRDGDLFLLFRVSNEGALLGLDLLSREERALKEEKSILVIQKLTNYLLHYLWFAL